MKTILKLNNLFIAIAMVSVFIFTSCNKDKDPAPSDPTDTQSAIDNSVAETEFDDVTNINQDVTDNESNYANKDFEAKGTGPKPYRGCGTVVITTENTGKKVVIDFGSEGCVGQDGKKRKGKIIITYTGRYSQTGSVITTTFDNFYVNDVKVEGVKKVTNVTVVEQGVPIKPKHKIEVEGKLTFKDGKVSTWNSIRFREWAEGFGTLLNLADDKFLITGKANGKNRNGIEYSAEITKALEFKTVCLLEKIFIPVSGTILIKSPNFADRTVDYGNGNCDNKYTVTVGDQTKEFEAGKE